MKNSLKSITRSDDPSKLTIAFTESEFEFSMTMEKALAFRDALNDALRDHDTSGGKIRADEKCPHGCGYCNNPECCGAPKAKGNCMICTDPANAQAVVLPADARDE